LLLEGPGRKLKTGAVALTNRELEFSVCLSAALTGSMLCTILFTPLAALAAEPNDAREPFRACTPAGQGYYFIPGTTTCLKIGGRVRSEFLTDVFNGNGVNDSFLELANDQVSNVFRTRGYVNFEVLTGTEFGLLKAYTEIIATEISSTSRSTSDDQDIELDAAFIQWGYLSAGVTESFFDFYTGANWGAGLNQGFAEDGSINLVAITAPLAKDVSLSVSLENTQDRQTGIKTVVGDTSLANRGFSVGSSWPDAIANFRLQRKGMQAQVMGAVRHKAAFSATRLPELDRTAGFGWAIGAGAEFLVPPLGPNTIVGLQITYSDGAPDIAAATNGTTADAIVDTVLDQLSTTRRLAIGGGVNHDWTKNLSSALTVSYIHTDHGFDVQDSDEWNVQANLVWSPANSLNIGAEIEYSTLDWATPRLPDALEDRDMLVGVVRIEHKF